MGILSFLFGNNNSENTIISYDIMMKQFDFLIFEKISSKDYKELTPVQWGFIFQSIFIECVSRMNEKNKNLVVAYFSDRKFYKNSMNKTFVEIVLCNYIDNLSKTEVKDVSDTGFFNPIEYEEVDKIDFLDLEGICAASIKVLKDNVTVNWNRISTVSSLAPLYIIYNMYHYISNKIESDVLVASAIIGLFKKK